MSASNFGHSGHRPNETLPHNVLLVRHDSMATTFGGHHAPLL